MIFKRYFKLLVLALTVLVCDAAKKKPSKLKLVIENKYEDIILFTYKSSRSVDTSTRFYEAAKSFGFNQLKDLDCVPNGNDCGKKLLDSIEEYLDKNILVILLNTDHSMVNCQKNALVYSLREKEEKIIISEHGLDQDSIGLQLVADANSLKQFLQDHLSSKKTLLEVIRSMDKASMEPYSMVFSNSKKDQNYRYFFNIEGQILQETIMSRFSMRAGQSRANTQSIDLIGILVQTDLSNENSTQIMDQIYNFLVHPIFEIDEEFLKNGDAAYSSVLIAITVDQGTLFLEEFFGHMRALNYPREKIDVYISCQNKKRLEFVQNIVKSWIKDNIYHSVKLESEYKDVITSRQKMVEYAKTATKSNFIFFVRSTAQLEDVDVLRRLVECKKSIVLPLLQTYDKVRHMHLIKEHDSKWQDGFDKVHTFYETSLMAGNVSGIAEKFQYGVNFLTLDNPSAFWQPLRKDNLEKLQTQSIENALSTFDSGFFLKAILSSVISDSLWRVKSMKDCYLVRTDAISIDDFTPSHITNPVLNNDILDFEYSRSLIHRGVALHLLNKKTYGQIVNLMNLPEGKVRPEIFRIFENHDLWERRYITKRIRDSETDHPDEIPRFWPSETIEQGKCPDTYEVALFTELFCDHLVEEATNSKEWHGTDNIGSRTFDPRYNRPEAFPAYDIGLFQLDLEEMWMAMINFYIFPRKVAVYPSQSKADRGGHHFIIRYKPEEQPDLRPHDDSSLYTINLALTRSGIDYEGGGTKFHRQNCSVTDLPKGHLLLHPGRLTHYHEGLATTKGTRYVLISFVNANNFNQCYQHHGQIYCNGWQRIPGHNLWSMEKRSYHDDNE